MISNIIKNCYVKFEKNIVLEITNNWIGFSSKYKKQKKQLIYNYEMLKKDKRLASKLHQRAITVVTHI